MSDRLREALADLMDLSPLDSDPEGVCGDWCHFCGKPAAYTSSGEPCAIHEEWCPWAAVREAMDSECQLAYCAVTIPSPTMRP